jgi:Zn-dependent protease
VTIVRVRHSGRLEQPVLLNVGSTSGLANLLLAAFNLLPIPPLDGSAVIERFVPKRHLPAYYHYRARALPLVMVLVILNEYVFHVGLERAGRPRELVDQPADLERPMACAARR